MIHEEISTHFSVLRDNVFRLDFVPVSVLVVLVLFVLAVVGPVLLDVVAHLEEDSSNAKTVSQNTVIRIFTFTFGGMKSSALGWFQL